MQCRITTEDPGTALHPRLRPDHDLPIGRRLRGAAGRRQRLRRRGHHAVLRLAAGQGDDLGRHARGGGAARPIARCASSASAASRPTSPFLLNLIDHPTFDPARRRRRSSTTRRSCSSSARRATARRRCCRTSATSSSTAGRTSRERTIRRGSCRPRRCRRLRTRRAAAAGHAAEAAGARAGAVRRVGPRREAAAA